MDRAATLTIRGPRTGPKLRRTNTSVQTKIRQTATASRVRQLGKATGALLSYSGLSASRKGAQKCRRLKPLLHLRLY